jgi:hypothetical protein
MQELMRDKEELLQVLASRTGRLVFLHLLTPCSPRYYAQVHTASSFCVSLLLLLVHCS